MNRSPSNARALIFVHRTRTVSRTVTTTDEVRYCLPSAEPGAHTPTQWLALVPTHFPDRSFPRIKGFLHSHPAACRKFLRDP